MGKTFNELYHLLLTEGQHAYANIKQAVSLHTITTKTNPINKQF